MPRIHEQVHYLDPSFQRNHLKDDYKPKQQIVKSRHPIIDKSLCLRSIRLSSQILVKRGAAHLPHRTLKPIQILRTESLYRFVVWPHPIHRFSRRPTPLIKRPVKAFHPQNREQQKHHTHKTNSINQVRYRMPQRPDQPFQGRKLINTPQRFEHSQDAESFERHCVDIRCREDNLHD